MAIVFHPHLEKHEMAAIDNDQILGDAVQACLNVCMEQGFSFPVLLLVAGGSGALLATRYVEHEDGQIRSEMLAGDADERSLGWPVNVMVVDALGKVVRLRVGDANGSRATTLN
jgi:hypothetical protein